jgi:integrase/recombinase XerD
MKTYLEPAEVNLLEKAATNLRDRLLVRLLSHLGCRISEAVGLTVQDVNLEHGTITIQHLKCRLKLTCPHCNTRLGRSHTFCPNCGMKVGQAVAEAKEHRRLRTLHLDGDTMEILRDYIKRGGPVSRHGKQFIFGINRHRAWQVIRDCAQRAGLPSLVNSESGVVHGVSPHRLRDSFAVMAVQQDDSTDGVRMLQEWLGHANIGTTMRYRKVAGQELKQWYQRLWDKKDKTGG